MMGKATTMGKAMEFSETPVKQAVRASVAIKEIERTIDNFGLGRLVWYVVKRWRFQISFLVNIYFLGMPVFRFVHQFFN